MKRREFFLLCGLSTLGLTVASKNLINKNSQNTTPKTAIAGNVQPQGPLLRFVSVADTGTGDKGQYAVAKAMNEYHQKKPYNLVILAGDNIYNNGEIEKVEAVFERPYKPLLEKGVKFHACLGNHDIRTDNGVPQVNYPKFNMLGRYYTFTRENVQFFALDTNGNADWKNQLIWLDKELNSSKAVWKIVFGHHPIYASGVYGSNANFIKTFTPIFQKYGVQLYINGHEHHYERTKPIIVTGKQIGRAHV